MPFVVKDQESTHGHMKEGKELNKIKSDNFVYSICILFDISTQ